MGGLHSRNFNPATDIPSLNGKVIIVTGGNRGIGYATVKHLACAGAKVYIASRNEEVTAKAIEQLKQEGLGPGNGEIKWIKLDLDDPREAKKSAEEFLTKEQRLDVLINNAASLGTRYKLTSDGISDIVMINYIAPFVFTRTLLPLLTATARQPDSDVRIVNVASATHYLSPHTEFNDMKDLNPQFKFYPMSSFLRYSHSKLLEVMWTRSLQQKLDSAEPPIPITAIAVHPGGVDTFTHNWPLAPFWRVLVGLTIASAEVGAYNSVFAAASKKVKEEGNKYKGAYLKSTPTGQISKPSSTASDPVRCDQVWDNTEAFLKSIGIVQE